MIANDKDSEELVNDLQELKKDIETKFITRLEWLEWIYSQFILWVRLPDPTIKLYKLFLDEKQRKLKSN